MLLSHTRWRAIKILRKTVYICVVNIRILINIERKVWKITIIGYNM